MFSFLFFFFVVVMRVLMKYRRFVAFVCVRFFLYVGLLSICFRKVARAACKDNEV